MTLSRWSALLVLALALPACGPGGGDSSLIESVWAAQNPQNVAITGALAIPSAFQVLSDGAGGAIIVWQDFRTGGSNADIYAQRVDATGAVLWPVDGVGIATTALNENDFRAAADGAGGAIIVWDDFRSGTSNDVFAQRISSAGVLLWGAGGKPVSVAAGHQSYPNLISDGAGGAIIAWNDARGVDPDIYAQRVDASGAPLWTLDGVPVTTATGGQGAVNLVSDGAGGAVAVWGDSRGADKDIYAQRLNAAGAPQWTANGVAVTTATADQYNARPVSDGSGGVIVVWEDLRNGTYTDIYAGRLTGTGTAPWTANGVALSTAPGYQNSPRIVTDGAGGAILVWYDENGGPGSARNYSQRLDAAGAPQWTAGGHPLAAFLGRQASPDLVSDGAGGAVFAWQDLRNGSYDIFAQRLNAAGAALWTTDGVGVCTLIATVQAGVGLVPNGFGGAVLVWFDGRPNDANTDLYSQGVSSTGQQ